MRNIRTAVWLGLLFTLFSLVSSSNGFAADRVALVIGNSAYQHAPHLDNPANDAQDIAKALTQAGFDVVERDDVNRSQMADAIRDFSQRIKGAEVALFYYAGHGMQMEGENYLLPVDANVETPADARFATINLADIQEEMAGSQRANIIVLDACRNNPFAKKLAGSGRAIGDRGLGRVEASGVGSLIVFATQPNNVALDGAGRNSPFASALVRNIATPHVEVRQMLSRVRADVLTATNQKQVPWDNSSLVGDVYLVRTALAETAPASAPQPMPVPAKAPEANPPRQQTAEASGDAEECKKLASPEPLFASPDDLKAIRKKRDWGRAVNVCKSASDADTTSSELRYLLGESYYRQKDYLNAQRQLTLAAEAGNHDAEQRLGFMFATGKGLVRDYYRAVEYINKAATSGNARAITSLGAMYSNGWGVPEDDAKALALFEKGIELGNPFALSQAGVMYFNGMEKEHPAIMQARNNISCKQRTSAMVTR